LALAAVVVYAVWPRINNTKNKTKNLFDLDLDLEKPWLGQDLGLELDLGKLKMA
jgi:hypothetical protein